MELYLLLFVSGLAVLGALAFFYWQRQARPSGETTSHSATLHPPTTPAPSTTPTTPAAQEQAAEPSWEWQVVLAIHEQIGAHHPQIRDAFGEALQDYQRGLSSAPSRSLQEMLQNVRERRNIYVLGGSGIIRVDPWTGKIVDGASQVDLTHVEVPPVPPEIEASW